MSYAWHATIMPCGGEMAHGLAIYMDVRFSSSSVRGGQLEGRKGRREKKEIKERESQKEGRKKKRKEKGKKERKERRREIGTNVA